MWNLMLENLTIVFTIMAILFMLWLGNLVVSLYHSTKQMQDKFDKDMLIDGVLKISCLLIGTFLFTVGTTSLFLFVDKTGIIIDGLGEDLSIIAMVTVYGSACVYYAGQIIITIKDIFTF